MMEPILFLIAGAVVVTVVTLMVCRAGKQFEDDMHGDK